MARVFFYCLAAFVGIANARNNGAPSDACETMIPGHTRGNTFSGPEYEIKSACYVILPTESMTVNIWDRFNAGKFKGVFMQIYDGDGKLSGAWSASENSKFLKTTSCGGMTHSGVTHKDQKLKSGDDTKARWTAPVTCKKNEEFTIKATVVKAYDSWDLAEFLMICNADHSNAEVMEKVKPPLQTLYCGQGSWAILPKGATDGFEKMLARGGWRHFYGAPGLRFERIKSPKPGAPNPDKYPQAREGSHYLYYKSKGTKKNDMAGLLSPFGIQGCFCLSFECHMATDGITKFTLSTIADVQSQILSTDAVTPEWRPVSFSFVANQPIVFAFQVFNSGAQTGGVGLDNIVVKPGRCNEKAPGYVRHLIMTIDPKV